MATKSAYGDETKMKRGGKKAKPNGVLTERYAEAARPTPNHPRANGKLMDKMIYDHTRMGSNRINGWNGEGTRQRKEGRDGSAVAMEVVT